MTEVAGLVLGTAALWETCVQIFDVVESGRRYGMDYELLRVKLEVERMRLLNWGNTIGLSDYVNANNMGTAGTCKVSPSSRLDVRLRREEVNHTVMRLLGCIQHLFQHLERMQNAYGLRPATPSPETLGSSPTGGSSIISSNVLSEVFAKSYESLKRNARERQKTTTVARRTKWAIHDKKKFQDMILEIRGFNDSLESLFPGSRTKIAEVMRVEVEASENVDELQLLQNATVEDHADISDLASARLEELGTPSTVRTALLSERIDSLTVDDLDEDNWEDVEDGEGEDDNITVTGADSAMIAVEKRLNGVQHFIDKKRDGALRVQLFGPYRYSSHVNTHCSWGNRKRTDTWVDDVKGFKSSAHAAFDAYHKRRYKRQRKRDEYGFENQSEEDGVVFDLESYPKYENVNPGTVTVEGFGLEAWDFAEMHSNSDNTVIVQYSDPGDIPAKKLLRRINELQTHAAKFGFNLKQDRADLKEFTGDMGFRRVNAGNEHEDDTLVYTGLFSFLNRTDIFVDFRSVSSVSAARSANYKGLDGGFWNLLWQIIVAKELIRRFEVDTKGGFTFNFTGRILASMIIADRWIQNVEIELSDTPIQTKKMKPPETEELKARAEDFKRKGNDAMTKKDYDKAIYFYTEAIRIDPSSAVYRANRSAAELALERYDHSYEDAYIATRLDGKYAKAWSRFGLAALKLGWTKKAVEAYENAIALAGKDATAGMRQGLEDAEAANTAKIDAINQERNQSTKEVLRKEFIEQDFEILMKTVQIHSRCHEQQVEGLILFAERMKWPWVNEVRDYAEEAYSNLRGGQLLPSHLQDWLFGLTLPGRWFSFKIMSALILCTPSLTQTLGVAPYYDCGLSLPRKSYWRVRTVLGRVLGCLPGVTSLCGWLGPCPPVEFLQSGWNDEDDFDVSKPRHIKLKARAVTPIAHKGWPADITIVTGDNYEDIQYDSDEELEPWMEDIRDQDNWIVPEPPVRQVSTCSLTSIQLKRDLSAKNAVDVDTDAKAVYRAQLAFTIDDNPTETIIYKLYTNPVFVVPPPCLLGPRGVEHEVHRRELPRYQERNIWTIERLKEHTAEDDPERGGVMVINATGQGAETLARAWCSERGKNAVVRRSGGPCFVCAVRAASRSALGTQVLIWVS